MAFAGEAWGPHARRKKCEELAAETRQSLKFSGSREEGGETMFCWGCINPKP